MSAFRPTLLVLFAITVIAGCSTTDAEKPSPPPVLGGRDDLSDGTATPPTLEQFARKSRTSTSDNVLDASRYSALREAALSYSAQAAYQRRSWEIFRELEKQSPQLSQEFNFNDVVYTAPREAGYVVPPVVSRATEAITIANGGRESVAADEYYRIEEPGHLVSVIPSWRDYLILGVDKPSDPSDQFLPSNKDERQIWDRYIAEGWRQGSAQADEALKENMNLLRRDYLGMIEYRRLVDAGLIKSLVISSSEVRAKGTPQELFVGQRRVKIESAAVFHPNSRQWKPVTHRFEATK
jgi:defect-in-organelle-trafficking protein DotC